MVWISIIIAFFNSLSVNIVFWMPVFYVRTLYVYVVYACEYI